MRRPSATLAVAVPRPLGPPFHAGAVRDALGVVRLLWLVAREDTDLDRSTLLTEAGKTLAECLELGINKRPDTLGYRAAVSRSAEAMQQLVSAQWPPEVAEVLRHAKARVRGEQFRVEDVREAKRQTAAGRG